MNIQEFRLYLVKNATTAEKTLLYNLQSQKPPIPFVFQQIIGKYIVDFYFPKKRLVVELDGSTHDNHIHSDLKRTINIKYDLDIKIKVKHLIRFQNSDVIENVDRIVSHIKNHPDFKVPIQWNKQQKKGRKPSEYSANEHRKRGPKKIKRHWLRFYKGDSMADKKS